MDYTNLIFWAVVFIVMVIGELVTMQLTSIWFAVGALGAFIAAFFLPLSGQITVFIIASILLLLATRPILKKLTVKNHIPTNFELNIGKNAIVIEEINNSLNMGRVNLEGVGWNAVSQNNEIILVNSTVRVIEVQSTKLIVVANNTNGIGIPSEAKSIEI